MRKTDFHKDYLKYIDIHIDQIICLFYFVSKTHKHRIRVLELEGIVQIN